MKTYFILSDSMKMLFACAFLFLLFLPLAAADIGIEVTPNETVVAPGNLASFIITLKNGQNFKDVVAIVVSGLHLDWKIPGPFAVEIPAGETREIDMMFLPVGEDYGTYTYTISAISNTNPLVSSKSEINLDVRKAIDIGNFSVEQKDTDIFVSFYMDVLGTTDANVVIKLIDEGGVVVASEKLETLVSGVKLINMKVGENVLAGKYKIVIAVGGTNFTKDIDFVLNPVRNVVKTTEISSNWLISDTVTVFLQNRGNVIEKDYALEEPIRSDSMTGFVTKPVSCDQSKSICNFVIEQIMPGETAMVTYRLDYWPFTTLYGLGGLVAIFLGHSVVFRAHRPKISKKYKRCGLNHNVIIEIKNSFIYTLRNVIVRDWVSPLARVYEEFDVIRPIMRKSDAGTELIWRLGDIKPQEERVLTYKIKPLIGGMLKMPKAYIRFLGKDGKTDKIYSKKVIIKHKI